VCGYYSKADGKIQALFVVAGEWNGREIKYKGKKGKL